MFTGIVEAIGVLHRTRSRGRLKMEVPRAFRTLGLGASVCVSGVCVTVAQRRGKFLFFDLSRETQRKTTLGELKEQSRVNLERPLRWQGRVAGHFVLGHVDGVARIREAVRRPRDRSYRIAFPRHLKRFIFEKGSVAVDGVSLTIGKVLGNSFWVHGVPHTLRSTNLQDYRPGTRVNIETDLLAKIDKLVPPG